MKLVRKICLILAFLGLIGISFPLLQEDAVPFLRWWIAILCLGVAVLPLTAYFFRGFHDRGYLFAKPIGIALSGYLLWLFSSMKLLKFTSVNGILCIMVLLLANAVYLYTKQKKGAIESIITKEAVATFFREELVFLFLFLIWCYIKGFKAEAYGTEKFMDYGFMSSMMRAEYMPPYDLWFSGGTINYYYFGQYLATFVTKVSGVTVNVAYNFMLMTIASLSMLLPYSIVSNLTTKMLEKKKQNKPWMPRIAGVFGGLLVSCSSNMHYPIFRWVVPAIQEMLGLETKKYWFPDATRYIGYQPETTDKTIHEFPSYSTVLGDLHAHYINLIFVVTVVGLLLAWYMRQDEQRGDLKKDIKLTWKDYFCEVCEPGILMITFFIGMFHMTNFWDFPIYFVVSGAVILFSNAIKYEFKLNALKVTALQGILVLLGSALVALPFTLNFDQISTEICIATDHTPFYQLLILWGLPVLVVIGFIVSCISKPKNDTKDETVEQNSKAGKKQQGRCQKAWNSFQSFLMNVEFSDLFILLLGLCAIGLILMPEVIYVKDIYSSGYKRANTMFKLTYQAFIMLGMCNGYIIMKHLFLGRTKRQKFYAKVALFLSIVTITYIGHSVKAWFGNVFQYDKRESLDAAAFVDEKFSDDAPMIAWLNENVKGQAVVLEANGDSYSDYERVSVLTGLQTVSGWYVHEWLWRGDTTTITQRNDDINTIYTSSDVSLVNALIEQYDIDYIYVGNLEREKFGVITDEVLFDLGEIVYLEDSTEDSGEVNYIIQIQK